LRLVHLEGLCLEVEVFPAQAKGLSPAKAGHGGEEIRRGESVAFYVREEPPQRLSSSVGLRSERTQAVRNGRRGCA
jgi:hypothetical protein